MGEEEEEEGEGEEKETRGEGAGGTNNSTSSEVAASRGRQMCQDPISVPSQTTGRGQMERSAGVPD